ncbi:MAG: gamma-glutamyltransferase family protein [Solirubrobacterales bacterium]
MGSAKGVIAAGHPVTAEAGAEVLREGGNAVDAAVCAVLTSFITESPLTGFGAGGFMHVHLPRGGPGREAEDVLVDFFVAAGGGDGAERGSELVPIPVDFGDQVQIFHVGAASCGVPGNPAGLEWVVERYGSMPLSRLIHPGAELARGGVRITREQAYFHQILGPILTSTPEGAALYAPEGRQLGEGDLFRFPDAADAMELLAAEGAAPFYAGEVGRAVAEWVRERGGTLGADDMAAYEPIEREPVRARFRGADVLTNPPPSSGGILIAYALALLERLGDDTGVEQLVAATEAANARRTEEFAEGLHDAAFVSGFFGDERSDALGSTTHLSVLDASGTCASVTCSNGTGSGMVVPGTGVHVNNMLGEEDLNPGGFHRIPAGRRVSSMMAPTVALRDGEVLLGLGSAGSNRIRSAILATTVRVLEQGMDAGEAVLAPRIHFEAGTVQAEPGVDEQGLERLESRGVPVVRWGRENLYFGGVQAVARDPATGKMSGGGDPRRGGAVVVV